MPRRPDVYKRQDISATIPLKEADYIESLGYNVTTSFGGYANVAIYSFAGPLASKEARWAVSYAMAVSYTHISVIVKSSMRSGSSPSHMSISASNPS